MSRLRNFHKRPDEATPKALQKLLLVAIALSVAVKLLVLPRLDNFVGLLFAIIIAIGLISSVRRGLEQSRVHRQALKDSPWTQVGLWEKQLIAIFTIPMVAARLVSLIGALTAHNGEVTQVSVVSFVASVLLLLALRPQRSHYLGMCAKCKSPIPIVFVEYGSCPACDRELAEKLRA
jgi:hypothetical protein